MQQCPSLLNHLQLSSAVRIDQLAAGTDVVGALMLITLTRPLNSRPEFSSGSSEPSAAHQHGPRGHPSGYLAGLDGVDPAGPTGSRKPEAPYALSDGPGVEGRRT